ncbi:probable protein arginine N-methyltransferase 3 [Dendrobium catenatum]|uniref:type I protein arginine methyltransferase n=1 Tax=Dendrobium catenatum TaxID=906689 RepID=A0A2I0XJ71_9ASPA|nr:probable protein arginine N-methyltransferase 3 [Dendrobium catenatum]PKU87939.1 putative protein arginine N-methyltransferase 3 [Dendrobium catenatum]
MATKYFSPEEEEEEEEMEGEGGGVWDDWQSDEEDSSSHYLCLFCDLRYDSTERLFEHCKFVHCFDLLGVIRDLRLDFYGSLKLINYIRSQVAMNKCRSGYVLFKNFTCLHDADNIKKDGKFPWDEESYLKPFIIDDALLHSFANDEDEDDFDPPVTEEYILSELMNDGHIAQVYHSSQGILDAENPQTSACLDIRKHVAAEEKVANFFEKSKSNGICGGSFNGESHQKQKDCQLKVSFANVVAREIRNVNDNYFGSYASFGIHKEMISDKVRTEAYRIAILNNPSLLNQATVMDVGCGTGILSLFAAQAGASTVVAVEASLKMAAIATQIAKDNGYLYEENNKGEKDEDNHCSGVIHVVQTMVEELDKFKKITPHSVDVLVSEWMGYCLLYESMLSSVLYARDYWLKPGGAILPDTATILVAGFGRGGTSLPFWENVYGFNMTCIGKEVMEDASCSPIIDVMNSKDIVTESAVLQTFDLTTMKPDEVDFTARCELVLKPSPEEASATEEPIICWCYGIVLWFETGFTSRFCKEMPTVLSTSPYLPKTHWSQTIFTFQEPVAMASAKSKSEYDGLVGTERCPAVRISSRISIARSSVHRSLDISMETTGISLDGRKRSWPVQIFDL